MVVRVLRKYELLQVYVRQLQKSGQTEGMTQFLCELVLNSNIFVQQHAAAYSPESLEYAISMILRRKRAATVPLPQAAQR
jgi:hypothetical protein